MKLLQSDLNHAEPQTHLKPRNPVFTQPFPCPNKQLLAKCSKILPRTPISSSLPQLYPPKKAASHIFTQGSETKLRFACKNTSQLWRSDETLVTESCEVSGRWSQSNARWRVLKFTLARAGSMTGTDDERNSRRLRNIWCRWPSPRTFARVGWYLQEATYEEHTDTLLHTKFMHRVPLVDIHWLLLHLRLLAVFCFVSSPLPLAVVFHRTPCLRPPFEREPPPSPPRSLVEFFLYSNGDQLVANKRNLPLLLVLLPFSCSAPGSQRAQLCGL